MYNGWNRFWGGLVTAALTGGKLIDGRFGLGSVRDNGERIVGQHMLHLLRVGGCAATSASRRDERALQAPAVRQVALLDDGAEVARAGENLVVLLDLAAHRVELDAALG